MQKVSNKQYEMKLQFDSLRLNGYRPARVSSADSKVRRTTLYYHVQVQLNSFHLNGHTVGVFPQTFKLEPPGEWFTNSLSVLSTSQVVYQPITQKTCGVLLLYNNSDDARFFRGFSDFSVGLPAQ